MRLTIAGLIALSMIAVAIPMTVPPAAADTLPSYSIMNPNAVLINDFDDYTGEASGIGEMLSNRTHWDGSSWEGDVNLNQLDDNPGFIGWYSASSGDMDSHWGNIGQLKVRLADPLWVADYYTIQVVWRAIIWEYDEDYHLVTFNDGYPDYNTANFRMSISYYDNDLETTVTDTPPSLYDGWMVYLESHASDKSWCTNAPDWQGPQTVTWYSPATPSTSLNAAALRKYNFTENPAYERPYTYSEVAAMTITYEHFWLPYIYTGIALYNGHGLMFSIHNLFAIAIPVEYEPEPTPTGSFILRPEDVGGNYQMVNESGSPDSVVASVNETDTFSDGNDTYIRTAWTNTGAGITYTLTDPPDWAADTSYYIYPWAIAQTSYWGGWTDGPTWWLHAWTQLPVAALDESYFICDTPNLFWSNYSYESASYPLEYGINPYYAWNLAALDELALSMGVYTVPEWVEGNLYISQMAVLCVPMDLVIPEEEGEEYEGVVFTETGGIAAIMGIVGFLGMVAVPTVMAIGYREGEIDGFGATVKGIILVTLFFGLFIAGLYAG